MLRLIKPITWFPPIWAFLCGAVSAGIPLGANWPTVILGMVLAGPIVCGMSQAANDWCDRHVDAINEPDRPIPSGRITLRSAWRVGLIFLLCGAGMMVGRGGADTAVTVTLALTILAYDLYHKPWSGSVLLMGACRTLLYLAAASPLIKYPWTGPGLLPGLALGDYIVGLSLIARQEAKPASTPKSPTWPLLLLLISPVLLTCYQSTIHQKLVPIALGIGLLLWINRTLRQMRTDPPRSIGPAVGKLLATIAWVDATALAPTHPKTALTFIALVPLLRLWQTKIAAT
jgi:hypothetical protein